MLSRQVIFALSAMLPAAAFLVRGAETALPQQASAEVELFVRQALEDRLAADDLPDANLLGSATRIAVRQEIAGADLALGPRALPRRAGRTFYLLSQAAAQAEADRTGEAVFFITIDRAGFTEDTATVWLGVDLVVPREPGTATACCCRGLAQFRRSAERWRFVEWLDKVCS